MKKMIIVMGLVAGCVDEVETTYGDAEQAIDGGSLASSFGVNRAVHLFRLNGDAYCSGTQIADDKVVTALHCLPRVGDLVHTWETSTTLRGLGSVKAVMLPPGTSINGETTDQIDSNGDHADIAVLRFTDPLPRSNATLAWSYPGDDMYVTEVASGRHDD